MALTNYTHKFTDRKTVSSPCRRRRRLSLTVKGREKAVKRIPALYRSKAMCYSSQNSKPKCKNNKNTRNYSTWVLDLLLRLKGSDLSTTCVGSS